MMNVLAMLHGLSSSLYSYYDYGTSSLDRPATYVLVITLAMCAFCIATIWKIFEKAGKNGYAALIPFYNGYVLCEIVFGCGWMFLLGLIPGANLVYAALLAFKTAKAFGQDASFAVGLFFLAPIFMVILGFGKAEYVGVNGIAPPVVANKESDS